MIKIIFIFIDIIFFVSKLKQNLIKYIKLKLLGIKYFDIAYKVYIEYI